ncbi:MAG: tail protein X [Eubacterium sp.]
MEYQTKAGDTWDSIAYEQLGSEKYMGLLMEANPELIAYVVFDSGVSIQIPEVPKEDVADSALWKDDDIDDETELEEFEEEEDE